MNQPEFIAKSIIELFDDRALTTKPNRVNEENPASTSKELEEIRVGVVAITRSPLCIDSERTHARLQFLYRSEEFFARSD
jgi:hypothetical protein